MSGWDAGLAVAALRQAIDLRQPAPGLVHHSDRGVQYASHAYVDLLLEHGIQPSMSRAGNLYDNARCESFMKTLKQEEIYTRRYRGRADLEGHIGEFIEWYYNRRNADHNDVPLRAESSPLRCAAPNISILRCGHRAHARPHPPISPSVRRPPHQYAIASE
jgi:hypothetical protein